MKGKPSVEQPKGVPDTEAAVAKRILQVIGQFVFLFAVLLITSGHLDWPWLWVYVIASICLLVINLRVIPRELIAERGQPGENWKPWDKLLASLMILPTLSVPVVAGLDERFDWSPQVSTPVHVIGLIGFVLGQLLFTWSMASNPFFSTAVRLQMDRGQAVATGGPYRYVRHPGYVGYIVMTVGSALIFGSLWALIPAGVTAVLMIVRTALEDKTLREELAGYQSYAQQVRFRLLPGVW
jgi:protein-S-isoprenylcysteine O-methyltransferase Ste14